jgi:23S rRNA (uracil1939-C5)-methyltransferase
MRPSRPTATPTIVEVEITALATGGDGVSRDSGGRVVFVPLTAPGDRVRARLVEAKPSFARAEVVEVVTPGASRVVPPCPEVARGCGGCQWQQVARAAQLQAKQLIVANALRKLVGLAIHPIADPCPPLGWRRRARFHVHAGKVGLYIRSTHRVLPLAHCPQLEPALDAALGEVAALVPPDGELSLLLAHDGKIVVGHDQPWPAASQLIGRAGIVGVVAGQVSGEWRIEVEPGLLGGPLDFAQASAAGNAALIAQTRAALGAMAAPLVELYAGNGNFTRGFVADGWQVTASDGVAPHAVPSGVRFEVGPTPEVLARLAGQPGTAEKARPVEAVVLDPPRAGAADAIDGIVRLSPNRIVYVSCDPQTLARDAAKLAAAGYRATDAWPIDLMPQTSHVEVVLRFERAQPG